MPVNSAGNDRRTRRSSGPSDSRTGRRTGRRRRRRRRTRPRPMHSPGQPREKRGARPGRAPRRGGTAAAVPPGPPPSEAAPNPTRSRATPARARRVPPASAGRKAGAAPAAAAAAGGVDQPAGGTVMSTTTFRVGTSRAAVALLGICVALAALPSCRRTPSYRTFASPEEAVKALTAAVTKEKVDDVLQIFGPEGKDLIDTSDPASARRGREVFVAAATEGGRLAARDGGGKTLVVGNEDWPFPVPLIQDAQGWHFDAAAGKEEVITRRIGRNELAAIEICQTYVAAQRRYARAAHDGKRPGLYAASFRSDPSKQNGLYWPARHG